MKLNAIGVASSDVQKTLEFYKLLGFEFAEFKPDEEHIESTNTGEIKLMIDSLAIIKEIIGENPRPGNTSAFGLQFDTAKKIDEIVKTLKTNNFAIKKEPWDAFWGQRYAVVQDPDGYLIDLYAQL